MCVFVFGRDNNNMIEFNYCSYIIHDSIYLIAMHDRAGIRDTVYIIILILITVGVLFQVLA